MSDAAIADNKARAAERGEAMLTVLVRLEEGLRAVLVDQASLLHGRLIALEERIGREQRP